MRTEHRLVRAAVVVSTLALASALLLFARPSAPALDPAHVGGNASGRDEDDHREDGQGKGDRRGEHRDDHGDQEKPVFLPFQEHSLGNGIRILTLEDHSVPSITYWTWFRVGSINERPGITGISHLFEHLMFRGAKKYGPGEFDKILESNGGYSNAFTDKDMTAYYEDFISDKLELTVDLDSDRMASLNVTQSVLDPERGVVKEERRFRSENSIEGALDEVLDAEAYLAHPYHWPVIGWMGDLDNITVEDCHDYFKTYYAPNNATIIVVGDFRTEDLIRLINAYYKDIPRQKAPPPVANSEPAQRGERTVTFYKSAQAESFGVAFHVPQADDLGFYAVEVIQSILGAGRSSRLYKSLVYDAQIATDVNVFQEWRRHPGLLKVYVTMKPGRKASEGISMLNEELARLRNELVSEIELQKAKNNIRASHIRQMKTNRGKGEVAGEFDILFGHWSKQKDYLRHIDDVTLQDVKDAADRFLVDLNRTTIVLVPEEPPELPKLRSEIGKEDEEEEEEEGEENEAHEPESNEAPR